MGISTIPAASSTSAPYAGATTLAASAYTTTGFYSTTLAAGKYVITVQPSGGTIDPQNTNVSYNSGTSLAPKWNFADDVNDLYAIGQDSGTPLTVNLTTTSTIFLTTDLRWNMSPVSYTRYYTSVPNSQFYRGSQNFRTANSNWDKGIAVYGNRNDNQSQTRMGWIPADTTFSGMASQSTLVDFADSMVTSDQNHGATEMCNMLLMDNYMFVGLDNAQLYSSSNSTTWALRTTGLSGAIMDVANGNVANTYVAVSRSSSATANLSVSTDGLTWGTRNSGVSANLNCVTFGNGLYVAAGNSGNITTSTDGYTWATRTSPQTSNPWNIALYNNGKYLLLANTSTAAGINAAYSTDGTTWTSVLTVANTKIAALTAGSVQQRAGVPYSYVEQNAATYGKSNTFTGGGYFWVAFQGGWQISTNATTWYTYLVSPRHFAEYPRWGYSTASGGISLAIDRNNGHFAKAFPTPAQYYIYNHSA